MRSLICKTIVFAWFLLAASGVYAQQPLAVAPASAGFLTRFDFSLSVAALSGSDPRFSYNSVAAMDADILDYVKGRTSLLAQYNVVMGNQQQLFDPNQGNYTLEGSSSLRYRKTEFAAVFHHVSRHLSDRQNEDSVSFNSVGGRVMRDFSMDGVSFDIRADMVKIVRHAFVDYDWVGRLYGTARKPVNSRIGVFGLGEFKTYGVNEAIAGRDRQNGAHFEGGLRVDGSRAAIEFFGGWESVVDAYPIARGSMRRFFAGLRVLGR